MSKFKKGDHVGIVRSLSGLTGCLGIVKNVDADGIIEVELHHNGMMLEVRYADPTSLQFISAPDVPKGHGRDNIHISQELPR